MQFKELNIMPSILKALEEQNYSKPTPIQQKAIPEILNGKDLLGCAQTGTGKTAAFAIPSLQLLAKEESSTKNKKHIRALVITPTRELALQVYESFCSYGKHLDLTCNVIFGGVSQKPQEESLRKGVDILIATPGRLNDLIQQKIVDISKIDLFILDEADRMLDMGFINDVKKIIAKIPSKRQTLMFSATMPPEIVRMSTTILTNPVEIQVSPVSTTVDAIEQYVYYVDKENKKDLLLHLLKEKSIDSAIVFTRTKHGADRIVRQLEKAKITAKAIHANKSQGARQLALSDFKDKTIQVLVATDIAARGIDINELSCVINFDLPNESETYVHRIGRTGRAGLSGVAISFCDFDEKLYLAYIESLIGKRIPEVKEHPYPMKNFTPSEKKTQPRKVSNESGKSKQKSNQKASAPKKKLRMTADGVLKEKRSNSKYSANGRKNTKINK